MKINQFKRELRLFGNESGSATSDDKQCAETMVQFGSKFNELSRELFSLKLRVATSPIKDVSLFRKLRKNIARILTIQQEYVDGWISEKVQQDIEESC